MIKTLFYLFLLLLIIAFLGIHFIAPYAILQPPRVNGQITPQRLGLKHQILKVEVEPNLHLKGYWIFSNTETVKGAMIYVHGIGGCKENFLAIARKLAQNGIESIVFDGRAHGESGGQFCTYGFYEQKDLTKIIDFIKTKKPKLPLGIWGNSMGGAVALLTLEKETRLQFGIITSTFTDLQQIVFDYKKRLLKGIGIRWISDYGLKRAGKIANFNPQKIKPIEVVKNIQQPILIAHGDSDVHITYHYGQQLFDNLKSTDKKFILVEGGDHDGLLTHGGPTFEKQLFSFIELQINK